MANYPTFQSVTATDFGVDATSHLANYPATVTVGDLLVGFAAFDSAANITTPTGWTLLFHDDNAVLVVGTYIKMAAGTEGGTTVDFVTSASQSGTVQIYRVTNWLGDLNGIGMARGAVPAAGTLSLGLRMTYGIQDYLWIMSQNKSTVTAFGAGDGGWTGSTTSGQDSSGGAAIASAYKSDTVACEVSFTSWLAASTQIWLMVGIPPVGAS